MLINKQKPRFKTNIAEVHAFIVVNISSSADCRTERTTVHDSSKKNSSYIFTVLGIIYIVYIYNIYGYL